MSLYLTAILPEPALAAQIEAIRNELSERFNIHAALKPPVHITLYRPLELAQEMEEMLVRLLKPLSLRHRPFKLDLLNFDTFNIQNVFIKVLKHPELSALQREIAGIYRQNKIDRRELGNNSGFHPHITVAYRDIPPAVFPEIWAELKNRKFKRSLRVDNFHLLKHDGREWREFVQIPLKKPADLQLF